MDHVHSMLESDPDDIVLCEVSPHGCQTLSDLVGFIGLWDHKGGEERSASDGRRNAAGGGSMYLLTVCGEPILKGEDSDRVHCELVGRAEYTDGDFLHRQHEQ